MPVRRTREASEEAEYTVSTPSTTKKLRTTKRAVEPSHEEEEEEGEGQEELEPFRKDFYESVYRAVKTIPYGKVSSCSFVVVSLYLRILTLSFSIGHFVWYDWETNRTSTTFPHGRSRVEMSTNFNVFSLSSPPTCSSFKFRRFFFLDRDEFYYGQCDDDYGYFRLPR